MKQAIGLIPPLLVPVVAHEGARSTVWKLVGYVTSVDGFMKWGTLELLGADLEQGGVDV